MEGYPRETGDRQSSISPEPSHVCAIPAPLVGEAAPATWIGWRIVLHDVWYVRTTWAIDANEIAAHHRRIVYSRVCVSMCVAKIALTR